MSGIFFLVFIVPPRASIQRFHHSFVKDAHQSKWRYYRRSCLTRQEEKGRKQWGGEGGARGSALILRFSETSRGRRRRRSHGVTPTHFTFLIVPSPRSHGVTPTHFTFLIVPSPSAQGAARRSYHFYRVPLMPRNRKETLSLPQLTCVFRCRRTPPMQNVKCVGVTPSFSGLATVTPCCASRVNPPPPRLRARQ